MGLPRTVVINLGSLALDKGGGQRRHGWIRPYRGSREFQGSKVGYTVGRSAGVGDVMSLVGELLNDVNVLCTFRGLGWCCMEAVAKAAGEDIRRQRGCLRID